MLEQGIERGRDRRHGADMLDQIGPRGFGLRVIDRVPGLVPHRARADIAKLVDIFLHLPGRERAGEVIDDCLTR